MGRCVSCWFILNVMLLELVFLLPQNSLISSLHRKQDIFTSVKQQSVMPDFINFKTIFDTFSNKCWGLLVFTGECTKWRLSRIKLYEAKHRITGIRVVHNNNQIHLLFFTCWLDGLMAESWCKNVTYVARTYNKQTKNKIK